MLFVDGVDTRSKTKFVGDADVGKAVGLCVLQADLGRDTGTKALADKEVELVGVADTRFVHKVTVKAVNIRDLSVRAVYVAGEAVYRADILVDRKRRIVALGDRHRQAILVRQVKVKPAKIFGVWVGL